MDPTLVTILVAAASAASGELGRQVWTALTRLVRRIPGSSGTTELAALEAAPTDRATAGRLARLLAEQSASDPDFASALAEWRTQAARLQSTGGVHNEFKGGTATTVIMAGDVGDINIGTPTPPPSTS